MLTVLISLWRRVPDRIWNALLVFAAAVALPFTTAIKQRLSDSVRL